MRKEASLQVMVLSMVNLHRKNLDIPVPNGKFREPTRKYLPVGGNCIIQRLNMKWSTLGLVTGSETI